MKIDTTRFGKIEVEADRVFEFPEGLPGLTGNRFALVADPKSTLAGWLQSVVDPKVALCVVDPSDLTFPFDAGPKPAELRPILAEGEPLDKLSRRVIVRRGEREGEIFLNLFAPIYFNHERMTAMQVPLVGSGYDVREPWPPRPDVKGTDEDLR